MLRAGHGIGESDTDPARQAMALPIRTLATERRVWVPHRGHRQRPRRAARGRRRADRRAEGRVIVSGMGKSGHVARKTAATLASTGTPSHYVHPAEASHGDLGMVRPEDVIVALSWSGETAELADLIGYAKRFRVPLIAITANGDPTLGRQAEICSALPKAKEARPNGPAPTTSTTMQLALGDALAVALLSSAASRPSISASSTRRQAGCAAQAARHHAHRRMAADQSAPLMADALVIRREKSFGWRSWSTRGATSPGSSRTATSAGT